MYFPKMSLENQFTPCTNQQTWLSKYSFDLWGMCEKLSMRILHNVTCLTCVYMYVHIHTYVCRERVCVCALCINLQYCVYTMVEALTLNTMFANELYTIDSVKVLNLHAMVSIEVF